MQLRTSDQHLIDRATALAAATSLDKIREYLTSTGSTFAQSDDLATVYGAIFGHATYQIQSLVELVTELAAQIPAETADV